MRYKKVSAAVTAAVIMLACVLSGCGKTVKTASRDEFTEAMKNHVSDEDNFITSDSEDGTSVFAVADNGWLAGFYECKNEDIAYDEFCAECSAAGIGDIKDTDSGYSIGVIDNDEMYSYYVNAGDTCLFMTGASYDKADMMQVAKTIGYADDGDEEK